MSNVVVPIYYELQKSEVKWGKHPYLFINFKKLVNKKMKRNYLWTLAKKESRSIYGSVPPIYGLQIANIQTIFLIKFVKGKMIFWEHTCLLYFTLKLHVFFLHILNGSIRAKLG
jgi:hypothetical protein